MTLAMASLMLAWKHDVNPNEYCIGKNETRSLEIDAETDDRATDELHWKTWSIPKSTGSTLSGTRSATSKYHNPDISIPQSRSKLMLKLKMERVGQPETVRNG